MSDRRSSSIKTRFPLFWQAIYPTETQELTIPRCRECGNLVKVSSYADIVCPAMVDVPPPESEVHQAIEDLRRRHPAGDPPLPDYDVLARDMRTRLAKPMQCGSTDCTLDPTEGAVVVPLVDGVLSEFDGDGNDTINFRHIPTDGLMAFGLVDPFLAPPTFYMLNLANGSLEVGYVNSGIAMPIGIGIEFSTKDGRDIVPISRVLDGYGRGGDLIHYKHCVQNVGRGVSAERADMFARLGLDPQSVHITDIVVGYKCHIPGWHCQVKIQVDCSNHIPYITTKASRSEE